MRWRHSVVLGQWERWPWTWPWLFRSNGDSTWWLNRRPPTYRGWRRSSLRHWLRVRPTSVFVISRRVSDVTPFAFRPTMSSSANIWITWPASVRAAMSVSWVPGIPSVTRISRAARVRRLRARVMHSRSTMVQRNLARVVLVPWWGNWFNYLMWKQLFLLAVLWLVSRNCQ